MDILQEIVAHKRNELRDRQQFTPLRRMVDFAMQAVEKWPEPASLKTALQQSSHGIIAEFKRKSPSKGWINRDAKPSVVPLSYQQAGAAAVSILTDTDYFGGYDEHISEARAAGVTIPVLYKNFVVDEYQLYQARHAGASAVLLIAACLSKADCKALIDKAHDLGLEVLLEMHSVNEAEYAELEPDVCGVNNRNLGSFVTDTHNSLIMAEHLPSHTVWVSESGINSPNTMATLRQAGYKGFLMGEHFMRNANPGEALADFIRQTDIL